MHVYFLVGIIWKVLIRNIFQVTKWLLSKGQVLTMGTYDTLLLALDMDRRVDEAETIWNMILQTHMRSVSKRLFSRMIALYEHHHVPEKIVEVILLSCASIELASDVSLWWLTVGKQGIWVVGKIPYFIFLSLDPVYQPMQYSGVCRYGGIRSETGRRYS